MKYLTSTRFGRTRSTSDKNQPSVELSLMTTSSPSLGTSPITCRDGGETVSVTTERIGFLTYSYLCMHCSNIVSSSSIVLMHAL